MRNRIEHVAQTLEKWADMEIKLADKAKSLPEIENREVHARNYRRLAKQLRLALKG